MKLYSFGDSFTNVYDDTTAEWVRTYIKWKGYVPKSYIDILCEKYDLKKINFAKQGSDNYSIFQSFCENFQYISDEDLIIINWSSTERFRVVNKHDVWCSIVPNFGHYNFKDFDISKETFAEMLINRTSMKYVEEVMSWSKLISHICKNKKIIQWTINDFPTNENINFINGDFQTIITESKGKINDKHFSERGNIDLANFMRTIIEKKYVMTKKTII